MSARIARLKSPPADGIRRPCRGPLCADTEAPSALIGDETLCSGCRSRVHHDAALAVAQALTNGSSHVKAKMMRAMELLAEAKEREAEAARLWREALRGLHP